MSKFKEGDHFRVHTNQRWIVIGVADKPCKEHDCLVYQAKDTHKAWPAEFCETVMTKLPV